MLQQLLFRLWFQTDFTSNSSGLSGLLYTEWVLCVTSLKWKRAVPFLSTYKFIIYIFTEAVDLDIAVVIPSIETKNNNTKWQELHRLVPPQNKLDCKNGDNFICCQDCPKFPLKLKLAIFQVPVHVSWRKERKGLICTTAGPLKSQQYADTFHLDTRLWPSLDRRDHHTVKIPHHDYHILFLWFHTFQWFHTV